MDFRTEDQDGMCSTLQVLLKTKPDRADILRRRIRNGVRVTVDLSDLGDRECGSRWPLAMEITHRMTRVGKRGLP